MAADDGQDPWPWLELPPLESVERYIQGLEAERDFLRHQRAYLDRQLTSLSRP